MMRGFFRSLQLEIKDLYNRIRGVHETVLSPDNSGLKLRQIGERVMQTHIYGGMLIRLVLSDTGIKALKILGIEENEIAKHDLVIFLYAVGLVRNPVDQA